MPNYGDPTYWDQRYKDQDGTTFDWLEDFDALEPLILEVFKKFTEESQDQSWRESVTILNLGCGNSVLSEELYDRGFKNIFNIDISPVCIEQMQNRNSTKRPELKCKAKQNSLAIGEVMDVRNMKFSTNTFDLIIDKSTIDALLCGDNAYMNTAHMMRECQRVLKVDGSYMAISYGNPEHRILHYKRPNLKFNIQTFQISPEHNSKDSVHYVYVCRKQEGADQQCEENWAQVEAQIKKEECEDNDLDPSPNQKYYESPITHQPMQYDQPSDYYKQEGPLSINIRNNILDQCSNQYENNFKKVTDRDTESKPSTSKLSYHSPYVKNEQSISPARSNFNEIDETIQGNIDGAMTEQQIKNKKAYVWAFGKNQEGELALGVYKDALLPRFVTGMKGLTAKWISSSNHHTALVTNEGLLMVSGSSLHGKLGIEGLNKTNINKFQVVPALAKRKVKQVSCGDYHTLCLLEDGTVYQFGGSLFKDKKDKIARPQNQSIPPWVPQPVQALYGKDIVQIDCGDFHSAALDANGDLYTWGGGTTAYNKGQCGHGHNNALEWPEKVKYLQSKRIISVSCGGFHTLVLTSENELYAFGSGIYGECGYGEYLDTSKPKLVKFPNDLSNNKDVTQDLEDYNHDEEFVLEMYLKEQPIITQIVAGGRHSMVITNKGKLYTFGYGTNGQLGLRNTSNYSKPQLVKDFIGKNVVQIAAGWNHSLALTDKGDIFACGYGAHGQLGIGDKESKTQFTFVQSLGNKNVSQIFAGGSHSWIVIDNVVPIKENWRPPSPLRTQQADPKSFTNTPLRGKSDFNNSLMNNPAFQNSNSASKPFGRNPSANQSPSQNISEHPKQSVSSATFGGNNMSFSRTNQKSSSNLGLATGDEFIQKVIEIQQQQLMKAQYFLQVTYCETEYCHRFVNFEVHDQFVKQFENILEEYIQFIYQQEKGVLYHKVQEVPQEFFSKKGMTPGDRLMKENQEDSKDYSELDDSFSPEDGYKGYTLCIICNPSSCGYDQAFTEWKKSNGIPAKAKKIVVNSSSVAGIKAVPGDENSAPLIGKIVFFKDTDIDNSEFEECMSKWMINFHRKLAKYCIKKPRYSELRPMKFSLT